MVIIGGGMAGVSCALECYDVQLDTIVLEMRAQVGGQINEIPFHVRNVAAGVYDDEHPLPLALERSAAILGDRARLSWPVDQIDLGERWVQSAGRRLAADAIVIATGVGPRRLPAAADGDFGGDVTYELGSDLDRFAGRPAAVIGGGDNATLDALALARSESPVTLVHRLLERLASRPDIVGELRDDPRITELGGWELDDVHGNDRLEEVVLVRPATGERRSVKASGLVVRVEKLPGPTLSGPTRNRPLRRDRCRRDAGHFTPGRVRRWRRRRRLLLADRHRHRSGVTGGEIRPSTPGGSDLPVNGDPWPVPPASEVVTRFRRSLEAQASPDDRHPSDGRRASERPDSSKLMQLLVELLHSNLEQWELEDLTRTPGADDATIARAKRSIDRLNLERHRLAERVDAAIDAALVQSATATPSTESPAMAFDRLSVLAIRLDRTQRAARTAGKGGGDFGRRLLRLRGQLEELAEAIDALLDDVVPADGVSSPMSTSSSMPRRLPARGVQTIPTRG